MDLNILAKAFLESMRPAIQEMVEQIIREQSEKADDLITLESLQGIIRKEIDDLNLVERSELDSEIESWVDLNSDKFAPGDDAIRDVVRDILSNATIEV